MSVPGKHSSNDLSFSVKIQTKSVVEILILAIPFTGPHFPFAFSQIVPQPGRARNLNLCFSSAVTSGRAVAIALSPIASDVYCEGEGRAMSAPRVTVDESPLLEV
jgi:hypothetical protein